MSLSIFKKVQKTQVFDKHFHIWWAEKKPASIHFLCALFVGIYIQSDLDLAL